MEKNKMPRKIIENEKQLETYFRQADIRLVALDLDRTTLLSDSTLADRTKAAIEGVIAKGIEVVVISGRPRCSLPQSILEIDGIRYLVTSNGAAVNLRCSQKEFLQEQAGDGEDHAVEKRVWAWTLSEEAALAILTYSLPYYERELLTYEAFVEGVAYAPWTYVDQPTKYGAPQKAVSYVRDTRIPIKDFPGFIRAHAHELDSFDLLVSDLDYFDEIQNLIRANVTDVYMTSSMKRMLEISNKEAGKASGLAYVLAELGLSPNQVIAFGDGNNDADMLAYAGLGVAMENAMPQCLLAADYIGESNDSYGVAKVLELLLRVINN